ncbi:hypothetical protein KAJ89_05955 [Candidatus Parcubacteria bacterium]|nr:hypothetical protein [Candidatus Parcubacteria bacterium]
MSINKKILIFIFLVILVVVGSYSVYYMFTFEQNEKKIVLGEWYYRKCKDLDYNIVYVKSFADKNIKFFYIYDENGKVLEAFQTTKPGVYDDIINNESNVEPKTQISPKFCVYIEESDFYKIVNN